MTSIATRRGALVTALTGASIRCSDSPGDTAAPVVHIFGNGSDMRGVGRGQVRYSFRLVLQPEGGTTAVASSNLGVMVAAVVAVLRTLTGFEVGEVTPDTLRTIAGSDFLSADVTALTMIDL